jgi:hypothetical protein
VGDEHHGLARLPPDVEEFPVEPLFGLCVDAPERLVHEQDLRVDRERARSR